MSEMYGAERGRGVPGHIWVGCRFSDDALFIKQLMGDGALSSGPVLGLGKGEIIYAYCLALTKVFGASGSSSPYIIKSHAEDRRGASVQVLLPTGHRVTTVKLNLLKEAIATHGGEAVENIDEEKACRTKLGVRANTEKLLEKWNRDFDFGWHESRSVRRVDEGVQTASKTPQTAHSRRRRVVGLKPRHHLKDC